MSAQCISDKAASLSKNFPRIVRICPDGVHYR
jgi:hypothetical protein